MINPTPSLKVLMNMAIAHAVVSRKFDGRLGSLGFREFLILYHLDRSPEGRMRRIDLAEASGLTASGVTRLLAPMEKIGLVRREADAHDARVSFVTIAQGGRRMLKESLENAEALAMDLLAGMKKDEILAASELLRRLGGTVR